jgi:2-polyprenyl-6-methoxyphenol hydroxylase-like FAD-dependent oxidoreductase
MPAVGKVLIVGAGIAGMTLAIGLKRAGIYADLVEIQPDWTGLGTGISLQGPALRALRTLGVLDRCIERGFGYSCFKSCDVNGNVTGTVELPRLLGPDYPATIGIMRQALHSVLQETLTEAKVPVRLGVTVSSLQQSGNIEVQFTDGSRERYDLVVGTDGAQSKIRELVFGPQFKLQYTGQVNWRATVSRPAEVQARHSFYGPRNKAGFNPVSAKQMYIYLVQNARDYPRVQQEQLPEKMREQLADFDGLLAAAREEISDPEQVLYRPVTSFLLPPPWYRDRVIVLGDAAHTTTPHLASGAGIAIEDSIVLALLLQSEQPLARVLENFMARRYERCRMVVENSPPQS